MEKESDGQDDEKLFSGVRTSVAFPEATKISMDR